MTRKSVVSGLLPAALGPYSHAIVAGGFVFCSGTAGIDPATGTARDGIEAQTEQALRNLAAILQAAGASTADLVKMVGRGKPLKLMPDRELPPEEFGMFLRDTA